MLETHPRPIAEASPLDLIYGIGLAPDDPLAQDANNWKGENLLGRVLEQVREELREECRAHERISSFVGISVPRISLSHHQSQRGEFLRWR